MTVREIIKQWLKDNGYDGLYSDECGCGIGEDEFNPCYNDFSECHPGYELPCDCGEGCDYHIGEKI